MPSYLEQYGVTEAEYDQVCNEAHAYFEEQQQQRESNDMGDEDDIDGEDDGGPEGEDPYYEGGEDRMLDLYMEDRMGGGMDF